MPSRPVVPPIDLASTFAFDSNAELAAAVQDGKDHLYARWSSPTVDVVEQAIAELEGAERSLLVASGMAAIHVALLAAVGEGPGTLLMQQEVYGGTHELVKSVRWPAGVEVVRVGLNDLAEAAAEVKQGVIYLETPTNPLVRVVDIAAVRAACGDAAHERVGPLQRDPAEPERQPQHTRTAPERDLLDVDSRRAAHASSCRTTLPCTSVSR